MLENLIQELKRLQQKTRSDYNDVVVSPRGERSLKNQRIAETLKARIDHYAFMIKELQFFDERKLLTQVELAVDAENNPTALYLNGKAYTWNTKEVDQSNPKQTKIRLAGLKEKGD